MNKIFEIVDLFCGGGGVTEGFKRAYVENKSIAKVVACINHDSFAIQSHFENHPDCKHFTEDIRSFNVDKLPAMNPENISVLWASLECTNFSRAKGGKPRDADSRTLANHLFKYIKHINPDYIMIENVREFMAWGDLDNNGKPVKMDKGKKYLQWINKIKRMGYNFDFRLLNCADYGAYQSRQRFFGIFAKKEFPIVFPQPTHSKKGDEENGIKKWEAVKEVLDLDLMGKSIFGRKKQLSENTYKRLFEGLKRYATKEEFLIKWNSANKVKGELRFSNCISNTDAVCSTVTTQNRLGVVFLSKYYSGNDKYMNINVDSASGTIKPQDNHAKVDVNFVTQRYSGENRNLSIERPTGSLTTSDHHHIVNADFLIKYHSNGKNLVSINEPSSSLTTKDRLAKIVPVGFLSYNYGKGFNTTQGCPAGALTQTPKHNVINAEFILNTDYSNSASGSSEPCKTLNSSHHWKYLISTIALMDDNENVAIIIYEDDTETMKQIKYYMAENGIIDVKMRMLNLNELKRIMGIGDSYILKGSQEKQKWMIGNMVHPVVPEQIAICNWIEIRNRELEKAA